jgi:copper chaperone CopZ
MAVDGVVSADVSYEEEKAEILYHPNLTSADELISTIDAIGFSASL